MSRFSNDDVSGQSLCNRREVGFLLSRLLCSLAVALLLLAGKCAGAEKAPAESAPERSLYKTSYRVIDIHGHGPFPFEGALLVPLPVRQFRAISPQTEISAVLCHFSRRARKSRTGSGTSAI